MPATNWQKKLVKNQKGDSYKNIKRNQGAETIFGKPAN